MTRRAKLNGYEAFYDKIERQIGICSSHLEIPELKSIIYACKLKPTEITFTVKNYYEIKLYKKWCDEFGNSFNIYKKKTYDIIYNDLSLTEQKAKIKTTDLYYGIDIIKIAGISKMMHLIYGKDEDTNKDYYILSLLGIDNYLRTYLYNYDKWRQISPLMIGIENLKDCANYLSLKELKMPLKKETLPVPCKNGQVWLSLLPATNNFLEQLQNEAELVFNIINER